MDAFGWYHTWRELEFFRIFVGKSEGENENYQYRQQYAPCQRRAIANAPLEVSRDDAVANFAGAVSYW